ncbi:MAG TPA: hypothetical protein VNX46_11350 [Candidatus Acidoferrum sp.]|nr:hypothetical protein [Candidatus Acidoferrum sp.]
MIDLLNIGPVPWAEECAQVGAEDYQQRARRECAAFIHQIRRVVGSEPAGASLVIKSFPHDFGSYLEVCCRYSDNNETAQDYAFNCEGHQGLERWDDQARRELGMSAPTEILAELQL